ncbi:16043_t:CDS:2, partial [Funneliformis geosporum]
RVIGYRANKMRQGKLSELIHSSQRCENLDVCNVAVHFEEILDMHDPSQLVISRQDFAIMQASISCKYFINGRQSNYTE